MEERQGELMLREGKHAYHAVLEPMKVFLARLPHRYTQVPGDHLSVAMRPHRRRWTGGFDAAALLRSKSFFSTVLSMPHVQIVIFALGLLQTGLGLDSLAAKMQSVPNAHCAKVGVSLRSAHSQIQEHASGWHFGLLLNGCKVPGGELSAGEQTTTSTTQVLTFIDDVDFNGFYFTPAEKEFEFDRSFFLLECLSDPDSPKIIAASGECGWFVGVDDLNLTDNLPASHLTQGLDHSFTLDYSQFNCRVPQLLDAIAMSVGGLTLLLTALHARFYTKDGLFGVDLPISILAVGHSLQHIAIVLSLLLSWRQDVHLILFHLGVAVYFFTLLFSESFPEERTFVLGMVTCVIAISSAFAQSSVQTAFTMRETVQNVSTSAHLSIVACVAVSFSLCMLVLRSRRIFGATLRLSPLVDACRSAMAQIEEETLQQIHVLVASVEREGAAEHTLVRTASAQENSATWWGIRSQIERIRAHLSASLTVSHETQAVPPRHLMLTREHILDDGSAGQRRVMWHSAAARGARNVNVPDVVCLDQLYFQAVVIAPMLELKVLTWARRFGAFMQSVPCNNAPLHNRPGPSSGHRSEVCLVRLGEGEADGGSGATIDWSNSIKCSEDSVAKVSERYNGAPQYLVDLVRQRIIFDSVHRIKDALLHICQDPDVVVVSIENGMAIPDSTPHSTQHPDLHQGAGFTVFKKPAVTVYLILTTPQAHDMLVAGFVLEVELWLRDIWDLFECSLGDHRAYCHALLSEQSIFSAALRHGLRKMLRWGSLVTPIESDVHRMERGESRGAARTSHTHSVLQDDLEQLVAHTVDHSYLSTVKSTSDHHRLTKDEIEEYFAVRAHTTQYAGYGVCHDNQGIPPVLSFRLGVDIQYVDNDTQKLVQPTSIWCAQSRSRLEEVLCLLTSWHRTYEVKELEIEVSVQTDGNAHVDENTKSTQSGVQPRFTSIQHTQSWYRQFTENECVMTPELATILRGKCSERGDSMEFRLKEGSLPTLSAHWASLLFSSRPFTLAFHKWQYRVVIFCCGCYMLYFGAIVLLRLQTHNKFTSPLVRFSATRLRGSASSSDAAPTVPGVASIGLMSHGCAFQSQSPPEMLVKDSSIYLSFRDPVTANGFVFRTLAGNNTEMLDAVVFT